MFHIYRHTKGKLAGKFDLVFFKREYIVGSDPQGHERRAGCYKAMRIIMQPLFEVSPESFITYQDDSGKEPVIYRLFKKGAPVKMIAKTMPAYVPAR